MKKGYSIPKENLFPKGSEWRKWDLHVHSPASANYSGDWNQFVIQLGNADCDVIGINDYFSVAGYKEIKRRLDDPDEGKKGNQAYREALEKLRTKVILPVVECRMNNIVIGKSNKKSGARINFHLIFNYNLDIEDIETAIKIFKVNDQKIGSKYSDPQFLLNDASVDYFSTIQELKNDKTLENQFLVWLPYDEYGGAGEIDPINDGLFKQKLTNYADIMGSGNQKQIEFFLWKNPKFTEEQYEEWFGIQLPCIKGSDSHNTNDEIGQLKDEQSQPINKYCWIKSDPTFEGLRQICNEPENRVFIGEIPEKLNQVRLGSTNYLASLSIKKASESDSSDHWFDNKIPINHDMVAIIGNRGEGKSALTDVIGLACNTHCSPEYFSFLTKTRFREKNGRLASQFEAEVQWGDGSKNSINLNKDPDPNKLEKAKYIPQLYLDKICAEKSSETFQKELRNIIFSHIPEEKRLGCGSLEELIKYRSEEREIQVNEHRQQIKNLNNEIVSVENRMKGEVLVNLNSEKEEIEKRITAHHKLKPVKIPEPKEPDSEEKKKIDSLKDEIKVVQGQIDKIDARIEKANKFKSIVAERLVVGEKLKAKLEGFEKTFERLKTETRKDFQLLKIQQDKTIGFKLSLHELDRKILRLQRQQGKVERCLSDDQDNGFSIKRNALLEKVNELQGQLDAPNKKYQSYLKELRKWEKGLNALLGDTNAEGSLKYFEEQIRYVNEELPKIYAELDAKRRVEAEKLLVQIDTIRKIYNEFFGPVQKLISENPLIKNELGLKFDSQIMEVDFVIRFLDGYIAQGKTGTFMGKEVGAERLEKILDNVEFSRSDEAIKFAEQITNSLRSDLRDGKNTIMSVKDQLRKGKTAQDVYDFIWSFEYLEPQYSLKLDEKDLTQLSPGERGTLLLVFYLLVDKSEYPIIIDQPEENLDSETVYTLLRPVIKDVKRRRQIIMVTHHPNIAVACDAEQVIYCEIDRKNGYKVSYACGAIESLQVNRHIVDVLEGTRPAFNNRGAKYYSK